MSDEWRNELATEVQMEKLRFFGCTWDEGITAGQASDALEECARQFPQVESAYKLRPATEGQLDELRSLQHEPIRALTCGEAATLIESIRAKNQKRREAADSTPVFVPPTPEQFAEIRSFGKEPTQGLTFQEATIWINQLKIFFSPKTCQLPPEPLKVESYEWRNTPATEKQKEKLRLLGCTFDEGITAGVAKLLIDRQKDSQTNTPKVADEKLPPEIQSVVENAGLPDGTIPEPKQTSSQPSVRHTGFFCGDETEGLILAKTEDSPLFKKPVFEWTPKSVSVGRAAQPLTLPESSPFIPPTPEQLADLRAFGQVPPPGLTHQEARVWIDRCIHLYPDKLRNKHVSEVTIQEAAKSPPTNPSEYTIPAREVQGYVNQQTSSEPQIISHKLAPQINGLKSHDKYVRKNCAVALGRSKDPLAVKPLISCLADTDWGVRIQAAESLGNLGFPEAIRALIEALKDAEPYIRKAACDALGQIKDASAIDALVALALDEPKEWVRQAAALALTRIKGKTPTYSTTEAGSHDRYAALEPVKDAVSAFAGQKVEPLLKVCASSDNCYWLPMAKAAILAQVPTEAKFTIGQSRRIADKIQWAGYCVEPDARYGGGNYDWNQTIGVFKPCESDLTEPSTAYLGAANLLRLCVLIADADGQIDEVELDIFRQFIENQLELTQTDHRRLQILEKLLVQDPSSASRALAKIAKSIPSHKRQLIGKVLVRVAAADGEITKDERRALERIFGVFEISQETLENQIGVPDYPSSQIANVQKATSPSLHANRNTPPVSEAELEKKREWREWIALQERITARQRNSSPSPAIQSVGTSANREQIPKPVVASTPPNFALDMEKVYAITNETKEVVGILSVLMADEPEASIALPQHAIVPTAGVSKDSSASQAVAQPTSFSGLDAAFQPILERLLARDSWPLTDFNALAREFQFMPLNIRDTLNEWADDALGDFILDGEDPVVIRRELMIKETN